MSKQVLADLRMVEEVLQQATAAEEAPMDPELAARIAMAEDRACAALERHYQNERPPFGECSRVDPTTGKRADAWPEDRQRWLESPKRAAWLARSASPAIEGGRN